MLKICIEILLLILPLVIGIAFVTLVERKVIGSMQRRKGPNVVGFWGLLQPIADGLKLLFKETILPSHSNRIIFLLAPVLTFLLSLMGWVVIPFGKGLVLADLNIGLLYIFGISSLGVYGIIMAGWASNSKYAFLGALRSAAQMISYEVSIGLIVLSVVVCAGSLNLSDIVMAQEDIWYMFPLFPAFIMFFVSALAETNRPPFDLPEAEAELVAGYNVEYSSISFALFFLGEYSNIILMSNLIVILFLGGWHSPLLMFGIVLNFSGIEDDFLNLIIYSIKVVFVIYVFIWVRATFPRYRYDQLMYLGWKVFLPFSLAWFLFISSIIFVNKSVII